MGGQKGWIKKSAEGKVLPGRTVPGLSHLAAPPGLVIRLYYGPFSWPFVARQLL